MDLNEILGDVVKEGVDLDGVVAQINSYADERLSEGTSKLASTRDQILAEKRAMRDEFNGYKEKYGWADEIENFSQDSYNDLLSQVDSLKTSQTQTAEEFQQKLDEKYNAGKVAERSVWEGKYKLATQEKEQLGKARDEYKTKFQDYLVSNKLQEAISSVGVNADPFWFDGFKASAKTEFNDDGLVGIQVRHEGNYIPIEDWKNVFPTTDMGKRMIPAQFNSGAGGGNPGGKKSASTLDDIATITDPSKRREALKEFYAKNSR
jgi:hypothetical protein